MLSAILGLAAPAILGTAGFAVPAFAATAIGSGLGALLEGRTGSEALQAAALGGLGGYLGGKIGGAGSDALAKTAGAQTQSAIGSSFSPAMTGGGTSAFVDPNALSSLSTNTAAAPTFFESLKSPAALGAGALAGLGTKPMMPKKEDEIIGDAPEGVKPKRLDAKIPVGYRPGFDPEIDFRFPRNFAEGGLASMEQDASEMNDKELISKTVDAIQNELPNPEEVLGVFVARFGEEALKDLVLKVQDGTFDENVEASEGMVEGTGDGMDDMVPATLEGEQDVLLSDGEFIVPADVVSGLGNGSSDAGSRRLYDMMDRVRQMRTGMTEQPDDVPADEMLPA
jgi:hypothetical protein